MATKLQVTFDRADAARLVQFWATALHYHAMNHFAVTMQDPEGNEFCIH